jgi:hypothetical protein
MSAMVIRRRLVSRGDLPGSNGGIYNPGALVAGDAVLLLCRREVDYRFKNNLVFPELLVLDRSTLALRDYRTLHKVGFALDTRVEDFRCCPFEGMRLAVHSTVTPTRIKPVISRMFDDALQRFDDFELPIVTARVEKNWVLFEHEGALHCLYRLDPLTIFVRDAGAWRLVKQEDNGWSAQLERGLSNSTNLIPFEDGYLGFWHTIANDRYLQGAYLLDRTLSIRYRTGTLLDGGDVVDGFKPGVIYVSALLEDAGRVLAFYGEGDAHTGVAAFDREELAQELRRSPFQRTESLRVRFEGVSFSDAFRALQGLRDFAERRQHGRIRLYVAEPMVRATIECIAPAHISVHDAAHEEDIHCTVVGATGGLQWR